MPFKEYAVLRSESLSSYYVDKKTTIIPNLLKKFNKENINVLYLPRGKEDRRYIKGFENIYIPPQPLNGLDLSYYANATLTGSGTMAREAAVLGTPAVNFFPNKNILSVDQDLINKKKIFYSRDESEIIDYIINNWRKKENPEFNKAKIVKRNVIGIIEEIINENS